MTMMNDDDGGGGGRTGRTRGPLVLMLGLVTVMALLSTVGCGFPADLRSSWSSHMTRVNTHRFWTFPANYQEPGDPDAPGFPARTTLRQIAHTSRGGTSVQIRLSNIWGEAPLVIGAASVAPSAEPAGTTKAVSRRPTPLTFDGETSVTIPAGQRTTSDLIPYDVPADHDVAVTLYLPDGSTVPSGHMNGLETSFTGPGNLTQNVDGGAFTGPSTTNRYFLTGLDVVDPTSGGTVVAIGDSLTDGLGSSTNWEARWPDVLHDYLVSVGSPARHVVNVGLTGGTLLGSGTEYFTIDVLRQPGVSSVIVAFGINDLNALEATPAELRAGFTNLVARAHEAGIKIILATITPLRGPDDDPSSVPAVREEYRQDVNDWLRGNAVGADAIVDFDAAVRDPEDRSQVLVNYESDGPHLNNAGYAALGLTALTVRHAF